MTEKLREALHETAERGRTATLSDTLWADAQRARRRERLVLPVVALVLIACAGAVLGVLTETRHEAGPADGSDLAVPSYIWGMSSDSENGGWGYGGLPPVAEDFQVGTAAALVETLEDRWAVVSAEDGDYHRLDALPHGGFDEERPVLTAQGDRIAWSVGARKGGVLRISVADLSSGDVRRYPVPEALVPSHTRNLTWSASGRYLAFRTSEQGNLFRLYVLDTRTGEVSGRTRWGNTIVPLAATDEGGVAVILEGLQIWKPTPENVLPPGPRSLGLPMASSMAISPDGAVLAMSDFFSEQDDVGDGPSVSFLPAANEAPVSRQLELSAHTDARVLGWTKDGEAVVIAGDPTTSNTSQLMLIDAETSNPRVVGTIDAFGLDSVQIATALMTADHPTVDRDEPSWVDHDFPWWRAFGFSLVIGLSLLAALNVRRRRMAG
jgi:hypothetical protein